MGSSESHPAHGKFDGELLMTIASKAQQDGTAKFDYTTYYNADDLPHQYRMYKLPWMNLKTRMLVAASNGETSLDVGHYLCEELHLWCKQLGLYMQRNQTNSTDTIIWDCSKIAQLKKPVVDDDTPQ